MDQSIKNKRTIFSVYSADKPTITHSEVEKIPQPKPEDDDSDYEMSASVDQSKNGRTPSTTSLEDIEKGLHYLNELN